MKGSGVPGDGARKIFALDELRKKSLAGWPEKRSRHSRCGQAQINPPDWGVPKRNQRQSYTCHCRQKNCGENRNFSVVIVGDVTGGQNQKDHWRHLREANQTKGECGMSAFVQFPTNRDGEHLRPERCDKSRDEI